MGGSQSPPRRYKAVSGGRGRGRRLKRESPMTADVRFWNRIAAKYAAWPVRDQAAYEYKLDRTQTWLRPDMTVLEVGCGTGTTALHHAPRVARIDAVDAADAMIAIARSKAEASGIENAGFRTAALEDIDPGETTYDMVMAHSLIHLLDDRRAALARFHALLKPGGLLVTTTVCLGGIMPWLRLVMPVGAAFGLLPKVRFFTPDDLVADMEAAGFSVVERWQPKPTQGLFLIARRA
jgi:2-polyprenyl-3-methyl-5-hydroxy-6-metoxy-1,4-benzoquinol methylase